MKKIGLLLSFIVFSFFCSAQYVDLGLPSKTLWKNANENGHYEYYDYYEAFQKYGNNLPTLEQWEELKKMCKWTWTGKGCKVVGPNGKSIYLPAEGTRDCRGNDSNMGLAGYYQTSSERYGSHIVFHFVDGVQTTIGWESCKGVSVRLVK